MLKSSWCPNSRMKREKVESKSEREPAFPGVRERERELACFHRAYTYIYRHESARYLGDYGEVGNTEVGNTSWESGDRSSCLPVAYGARSKEFGQLRGLGLVTNPE